MILLGLALLALFIACPIALAVRWFSPPGNRSGVVNGLLGLGSLPALFVALFFIRVAAMAMTGHQGLAGEFLRPDLLLPVALWGAALLWRAAARTTGGWPRGRRLALALPAAWLLAGFRVLPRPGILVHAVRAGQPAPGVTVGVGYAWDDRLRQVTKISLHGSGPALQGWDTRSLVTDARGEARLGMDWIVECLWWVGNDWRPAWRTATHPDLVLARADTLAEPATAWDLVHPARVELVLEDRAVVARRILAEARHDPTRDLMALYAGSPRTAERDQLLRDVVDRTPRPRCTGKRRLGPGVDIVKTVEFLTLNGAVDRRLAVGTDQVRALAAVQGGRYIVAYEDHGGERCGCTIETFDALGRSLWWNHVCRATGDVFGREVTFPAGGALVLFCGYTLGTDEPHRPVPAGGCDGFKLVRITGENLEASTGPYERPLFAPGGKLMVMGGPVKGGTDWMLWEDGVGSFGGEVMFRGHRPTRVDDDGTVHTDDPGYTVRLWAPPGKIRGVYRLR